MARRSNDDLDNMTLRELKAYSDTNPAEGLRISKRCKKTSHYASKNYKADRNKKILDALGFPPDLEY